MNCDEMDTLVHGYMDGELDALTNRSIEDHLATCESCRNNLASFRELQSGLRNIDLYHDTPLALVARVRADTAPLDRPRRVFNWRALAVAASFAIVFIGAWELGHIRPSESSDAAIGREVVADHVRSLMAEHLVDVRSSDKHTVKPWFDGKLDFAPPVERLDGTEYPLIGGRLEYISGHPAAAVVYRHNKHFINLFLWPAPGPDTSPTQSTDRGYNLVHWTSHGMAHWAASDIAPSDLQTFTGLIRSAN